MSFSKVDQAISIIRYGIKKRQRRIDGLSRKIEPSESEKIFIGEETEFLKNINILISEFGKEYNKAFGKLPPQATDLEESVLGAIILEGISLTKVKGFLRTEHFYLQRNQLVYEALIALLKAGNPVDMRTVVVQLRRTGKLEAIGGAVYVAQLTANVASAANIEYHARVMIEYAIKRELILMAGEALSDAYEDTTDCFDIMENAKKRINQIDEWTK